MLSHETINRICLGLLLLVLLLAGLAVFTDGEHKIDLAEWLLVFFTAMLWWFTVRLVEEGKQAAKAQLRAYVGVSKSAVVASFEVHITLRNFGQTPAHLTEGVLQIRDNWDLKQHLDNDLRITISSPFVLMPHAEKTYKFLLTKNIGQIWLVGHVGYVDAFGACHQTKLSLLSVFDSNDLTTTGRGNEAT